MSFFIILGCFKINDYAILYQEMASILPGQNCLILIRKVPLDGALAYPVKLTDVYLHHYQLESSCYQLREILWYFAHFIIIYE